MGKAKNFWVVKKGKVGVARRNQKGRPVDFRRTDDIPRLEQEVNGDRTMIVLRPPRGVRIKPLVLPAIIIAHEVDYSNTYFTSLLKTWQAEFRGVKIFCDHVVSVDKDTPAARAWRKETMAKKRFILELCDPNEI